MEDKVTKKIRSSWDTDVPNWKDDRRNKFEYSFINPILETANNLYKSYKELEELIIIKKEELSKIILEEELKNEQMRVEREAMKGNV